MVFARSCILLSLTLQVCHADELGWQARDGALTAQVPPARPPPGPPTCLRIPCTCRAKPLPCALPRQVHLAQLKPDGSLAGVPEGAQVVLEIGANTRNTLDRELLPQRSDAFLITFEPLLDKYAALLARNSRPDTRATLGAHHPRGLVLPFAVSGAHNGVREFKISGRTDGCASLLDPVSSYYSQDCTNLTGVLEKRRVPSVSLEVVLRDWLPGRRVARAKVDAQRLGLVRVRVRLTLTLTLTLTRSTRRGSTSAW